MFCKECGVKLEDSVKFCSNCGTPVSKAASTNHDSGSSEVVLMSGLCNRVKNPLYVQNGSAVLTNKRFLYINMTKLMFKAGTTDWSKGPYELEIPLEQIAFIEDGRQGISKILVFVMKTGERYKFYVTNREEWKIKLQNEMSKLS